MVYRLSWIAGIAAIALAFWEVSLLLRDSVTGTPWQVAIVTALLLGAGITWTAIAYRSPASLVAAVNVGAFIIVGGLIVAPDTLLLFLPTPETWGALQDEWRRALEIIRYSVEPVRPVPGVLLLLSLLFWVLGFLLVAGLLNDRPFVATVTPIILAIQFSIIDRKPPSATHLIVFVLIVAFLLIAVRSDQHDRGAASLQRVRADRPPSKRPTPAIGLLIVGAVTAGLGAVALIGDTVPTDGFATWRSPSGYSDAYSGSSSYNPFTDIRASLISLTETPIFTAEIQGMDPLDVRFRTVTLNVFENGRWATDRIHSYPAEEAPWIHESQRYRGETVSVVADITIQALTQPWMPAPATPNGVIASREDDTRSIQIRRLDGSLILPGDVTYEGMTYSVRSDVPRYTVAALAVITRTETGELSPLFQAAVDDGQYLPDQQSQINQAQLVDVEFWTATPDDLGGRVRARARQVTDNLETNFEKALALEHYFRTSGEFVYNTQVPSQYTTGSIDDWLTDASNPFVRNGYCEQFATAMALMARSLDVPARVVLGFTPGVLLNPTTVQVQDKNAHAWVEIWVPAYGWMSFDPTPRSGYAATTADENLTEILGFSAIAYASAIPDPDVIALDDDVIGPQGRFLDIEAQERTVILGAGGEEGEASGITLPPWLAWILAGSALLSFGALLTPAMKWIRRRRRLRRLSQGDITAAWEDITDRLADFGEPFDAATTPLEAARSVSDALVPLARSYGAAIYGRETTTTTDIERAATAHAQAVEHITSRYSRSRRVLAALQPTKLREKWSGLARSMNEPR